MAKHFAAWGRLMRDDMNRPTSVDVAIIGAGPAGLTAAYLLAKQGYRVTVIEKDPHYVGGISRTVEHEGFRFDIGGHRFFSKSQEVVDLWRSEEHTSELQSLMRISYAVFCLKKKKQTQPIYSTQLINILHFVIIYIKTNTQ